MDIDSVFRVVYAEFISTQLESTSIWLEDAISSQDHKFIIEGKLLWELKFKVAILLKWYVTVEEKLDGVVL